MNDLYLNQGCVFKTWPNIDQVRPTFSLHIPAPGYLITNANQEFIFSRIFFFELNGYIFPCGETRLDYFRYLPVVRLIDINSMTESLCVLNCEV